MKANNNNLPKLRDQLFECLDKIKNKQMTIDEARATCQVAQTILNSVRLEMDMMKLIGLKSKPAFFLTETIEAEEVKTDE